MQIFVFQPRVEDKEFFKLKQEMGFNVLGISEYLLKPLELGLYGLQDLDVNRIFVSFFIVTCLYMNCVGWYPLGELKGV